MRRFVLLLSAVALTSAALPATHAFAQQTRAEREEAQKRKAEKDKADKAKAKKQDSRGPAPLAERNAAGPCPYVKVLYDAARYVEFEGKQASANVGYTGEIEGVTSDCSYKSDDPITVQMAVGFEMGKGPQAAGTTKTYRYWVAVTERNKQVLAKEYFDVPVQFPAGVDRLAVTDQVANIVIPRKEASVNGNNFEILVGFDVTPEMAEFNRQGSRFRINAGQTAPAPAAAPAAPAGSPANQ